MSIIARGLKAGAYEDFWAAPPEGSMGLTRAGIEIGAESALHMGTFWRCLNLIGGTFGSTPLILYRRRPPPARGRDKATDRPEFRMLRLEPSPGMSAHRYRKVAMNHILTWGNHYAEKVYDGFGQLRELVGLRPDRMTPRWQDNGSRIYIYRQRNGVELRLPESKVFHVPGLGFDGLIGYAPLTLMRETVGSYMASRDFGASFFRNGARPAVVMSHPKTMSQPAIDRLTAQMDRLRGSGNAGKTVLLEEGADFKELGIPPEDAQFMESQKFYGGEAICTWMGVPPHMAGLVEKSTSWGTGVEEQKDGFVSFTMLDHFTGWEQESMVQLFPGEDDVYAEFLIDILLRGKTLDRWQAYKIGRDIGALSPNDILDRENMNPREDDGGDEYLLPLNMESVGENTNGQRTVAVLDPRTRRNGMPLEVVKSEPVKTAAEERREDFLETVKAIGGRPIHVEVNSPPAPDVNIHEGAIQVTVPINEGAVQVAVPITEGAVNINEGAIKVPVTVASNGHAKSVSKRVLRDDDGRITGIVEEAD